MATIDTIAAWHDFVRHPSADGLDALLSDDVVFHSPIVHTPQVGKPVTTMYITAALRVLANDTFHYVREVIAPRDAALEFQAEIDGIVVNGIDLIRWNDAGRIVDFKVMLRPVKALQTVVPLMAQALQGGAPG